MQRCSGWAAPLATLPHALTQKCRLFHLRMLLSLSYSLQVCCGRNRVSWTRHNCSQLPWPQNDTSICPCIHWRELSHMAPHRCKGAGKYNSAARLERDLVATWPACDTKANPTHIEHSQNCPLAALCSDTHLLSQGQQGLGKLYGCTIYLDRWGKQETKCFFPLM